MLPNAEPRLVKEPIEVGGWSYPVGVCLVPNVYLIHHDAEIYPDPYAFRPERFLEQAPGTYTWIPFGGGRRRCIGASFAIQEMKIVLRAVLSACELQPATGPSRSPSGATSRSSPPAERGPKSKNALPPPQFPPSRSARQAAPGRVEVLGRPRRPVSSPERRRLPCAAPRYRACPSSASPPSRARPASDPDRRTAPPSRSVRPARRGRSGP